MTPSYATINGLVLVDKAAGPTSHAVVAAFKRVLRPERIGHLGTLDPFASGLLPMLLGGATRLADEAMEGTKGYTFSISFGVETDTLDLQGQPVREAPYEGVSAEAIETILPLFLGVIEQVPPAYSALKHNGRPLYEYMRAEGKLPVDIAIKKRAIEVFSLTLDAFEARSEHDSRPRATLSVTCGKGTYVRCLARDIASALGSAGHCVALRRTMVAPWTVNGASVFRFPEGRFEATASEILERLRSPAEVVPHLPEIRLPAESHEKILLSGNFFSLEQGRIPWHAANVLPAIPRAGTGVEAAKALVRAGQTLYLAELLDVGDTVKVQPRKKVDWV